MKDEEKTKDQLIKELVEMRKMLTELKAQEADRKQAQKALRESEERFKDITKNALEWIWEVDTNGKYTYASSVVERILGYKPEEILKKHFYDLFHTEDREELKKTAFEVFAKRQSFREFINRNMHKNGKTIWLSTSGIPMLDDKGNLLGYRGADTDITERKQAEKTLRESEEKYRTLTENVNVGVYRNTAGLKGKFIAANPAIVKMFGHENKEEFLGINVADLYQNPEGRKKFNEKMLRDGFVHNEELQLQKKNGTSFIGSVSAVVVKDEKGIIKYYDGIIEDVTERKQTEEELKVLATTDTLTEVLNRRTGLLLFTRQLQMSKRNNSKLSVCYLDVDDLKKINDTYGHQEGDEVLKIISRFLKEITREVDIICRLGGDEFLLILPQCSINQTKDIWERIAKKIVVFNTRQVKPYSINLSHGFAEYDPAEEKSVDQLIAIADREMYKTKHLKSKI